MKKMLWIVLAIPLLLISCASVNPQELIQEEKTTMVEATVTDKFTVIEYFDPFSHRPIYPFAELGYYLTLKYGDFRNTLRVTENTWRNANIGLTCKVWFIQRTYKNGEQKKFFQIP